ncbi:MAG: YDG domain-containing protein, partial [Oscillospiraceae bacterium]
DTDADYSGKVEIPFTIGQKEVSVMGYTAVNREYDGTTKVTIDGSKAVVNPADIFSGDEVKVADGAKITFTGTVKLPAANTAAAVTVVNATAAMLDGAQGANYKLSAQPFQQVMAVISQRPLTVSGVTVADKEYDGTTKQNSAVTFTTDKVAVDDLDTELKITYEMTYDNKDAGANNKTAHFTNLGIQGTSKDNYTLKTKTIDGKNCTITKKAVTVSPVGVRAYVGDAKPTTTLVYNGFIGTDNESVNTGTKCSFTFAPEPGSTLVKNDDRAKISAKLDGALAQNYTFVK